ncbi:MAG: DUF934 domain-containing protein [Burkholderiaceae bacterium]
MRIITAADDDYAVATEPFQPTTRPTLLPWAQWSTLRTHWPRDARVGIVLPNTVDVTLLRADLPRWSVVALEFPKWTDGRAYSQARLLRARLGYGGEIRAHGEVLVDMLPLLQRSGFDAACLRDGQSAEAARRAFGFFPGHYQGDVLELLPLFARRAA